MASKRGRNRKQGQRHKGGKLVQRKDWEREDEAKAIARLQRYKSERMADMDDPNREGSLSEAYIDGRIDERQVEAGRLFAKLVRKYAAVTGIPMVPRTTARMDPLPPGMPLKEEPAVSDVQRVRADYDAAFAVLKEKGTGVAKEVSRVAVWGEVISWPHGLREGLSALVEHFAIETGKAGQSPASRRISRYNAPDYKPVEDAEAEKQRKRSA